MNQEKAPEPVSAIVCFDDNEVEPLTGEPFFHMTMSKSHLFHAHLPIPTKFTELLPKKASVPVVLCRGTRTWHMRYMNYQCPQRRFCCGWKAFVQDNMLNLGDICLFELMSNDATLLNFKVQILQGDFPSALLETEGATQDSPAVIEIK